MAGTEMKSRQRGRAGACSRAHWDLMGTSFVLAGRRARQAC